MRIGVLQVDSSVELGRGFSRWFAAFDPSDVVGQEK